MTLCKVVLCLLVVSMTVDARIIRMKKFGIEKTHMIGEERLPKKAAHRESKYECTNGKNPSKLGRKEYLDEFAKGPCTPLIIEGGLAGTKLKVKIDCDELKKYGKELFNDCGWKTCNEVLGKLIPVIMPESEYTVWVPPLVSPFTFISPFNGSKRCLAGLLGFRYDRVNNKLQVNPYKGVEVAPEGLTSSTRKSSSCGFDSISVLLSLFQNLDLKPYFKNFKTTLESRGYRSGLTMQALPYDWRGYMDKTEVNQKLRYIIKNLYQITGKKVSILAHSYGNLNTVNALRGISQSDKDNYIMRYFAVAPPFGGTPKTAKFLFGGEDEYLFYGFIGINFKTFKETLARFPAIFELMPRNSWVLFQNTPWMKSIVNRIEVENNRKPKYPLTSSEDIVDRILPSVTDTCYGNTWKNRDTSCSGGLNDLDDVGMIEGHKITSTNLYDMLKTYSFEDNADLLYNKDGRKTYDRLENPGVETVVIYSSISKTQSGFEYKANPKPRADKSSSGFINPDSETSSLGDGTVLTSSALLAPFKWAYEYENKVAGAKPIIFAEVCSTHNRASDVYVSRKERKSTENKYIGLDCRCHRKSDEEDCRHAEMLSDQHIVDFVLDSLMDYQTPSKARYFDKRSEKDVESYAENCNLLNENKFI